jgi:electron transfer flavoprotein alpha subunit
MSKILAIVERAGGGLDESAWELLAAGRALAGDGGKVAAALLGHEIGGIATELATGFDEVHVFDDARLTDPDGEADGLALEALIAREKFEVILAPHTNRGIDLAPGLSVKLGVPLLADCFTLEWKGEQLSGQRTVFGGKVHATVTAAPSEKGCMATLRGGAFPAATPSGDAGTVHAESLPDDFVPRRKVLRTLEPEAGEVDITGAEILVSVGRGIEDDENLEIVEALAEALGGEVCCSRPVVDKGWLPKSRQVGTSGLTVSPKVYLAVGISGSFQHIGGIKGSPYVVAINKDPAAPIFGVADVGIVGDLLEVVPALEDEIRKAKS